MTTTHMIQTAGVLTLAVVLLLALVVVVLRLAALPLAGAALALDHTADLVARPLPPIPTRHPEGGTR
ncbi:hypothetical protein BJF83_18900 [Nocardiopsis sp. CNR-923]|uniref:hypothetical protein n=1 Tax=Nocardiopsis sp. CNR-923 TaxID=1904965 RepID=UPI0009595B85|nr:hypothetical protein [Nocardiopsis sp. CNR-923]OLT27164.1 hypothetical protein BJF83_18900 [Nocardiopsis sp. CNR-923]